MKLPEHDLGEKNSSVKKRKRKKMQHYWAIYFRTLVGAFDVIKSELFYVFLNTIRNYEILATDF
jgi:hypothetical protein